MKLQRVVSAIVVLALACNARQEFPNHRPFEADPETAPEVTDEDIAVFEAVISAYADSGEVVGLGTPAPPPPGSPAADRRLTAGDVARLSSERGLAMLESTRRCGEVRLTGWWDFRGRTVERLELPSAAAADFDRRNERPVALDRFQPRSLKVIRVKEIPRSSRSILLPEERKRMIELPGLRPSGRTVVFSLPGYSAMRDVAVVEITRHAPSPFGFGSEFVFLRRSSGGWRAIAKQIGCVT